MRAPRTGSVLLVAFAAMCLLAAPATAGTGGPSSGPDPVVAEQRASLELAAEAYALEEHNDQRRAGGTRRGASYGDVSRQSPMQAWTDMMTVSRRWSDRFDFGNFEHNPNFGGQYGYWSSAAENIAVRSIIPASYGTPTRAQVIDATEHIMQSWWTSSGHRRNWMDPRFDDFSVGASIRTERLGDTVWWVLSATANFRRSNASIPSRWRAFPTDGANPPNEVHSDSRYGDVPPWHTFHGDVEKLARSGITAGCGGDRFCPDDLVTRGQMAAFLDRALNLRTGNVRFVDTRGHTFEASISALATADITNGCNPPANTRYCPDDHVTRAQMAAFLDRALDLRTGNVRFSDTRGDMFEASISALATADITRGCNPPANTRFCPDDFVTRGQMAAFLVRAGLTD